MTIAPEAPEAHAQPDAPVEAPRRNPRWMAWVAVALVALCAGSFAVWRAVSASALDGVSIELDAQPVTCTGTEVGERDVVHDGYVNPVVVLDEEMACVLRFHVVNDGWAQVQVEAVTLAGFGSDNVLGLDAHSVNPNAPEGVDVEGGRTFPIDFSPMLIPPGESAVFEAWFGYEGGAMLVMCGAQGMAAPGATVSAPGVEAEVTVSPRQLVWFQEGSLEECATP